MKTNADYYRILQRKFVWARNAAEYCRVKAATIRDEAVSKIYAEIAAEADAEANKISQLTSYYFNRHWDETYGADTTSEELWNDFIHRRGKFAAANA